MPENNKPSTIESRINSLKTQIYQIFDEKSLPPIQINLVLEHLKNAENLSLLDAQEKQAQAVIREKPAQPDKLRDAWYELAKAELSLLQGESTNHFFYLPNDDPVKLKLDIYRVWCELEETRKDHPQINPVNVCDWLQWADDAISKDKPPDPPKALYYLTRARASIKKSITCAKDSNWGTATIFIQLIYLLSLPATLISYCWIKGEGIAEVSLMSNLTTVFQLPRYVFLWGFLGGVSWCMYNAAYWTKRRLFDRHYFAWYLVHPFISAPLAGAAALIYLGGLATLITITKPISHDRAIFEYPTPSVAMLSLISFLSGFSTHHFWKLLDRTVNKLFGKDVGQTTPSPRPSQLNEVHKSIED